MSNTSFYTIGIDYGSESGRVLIVDVRTGTIKGSHVTPYAHGVIIDTLPDGSTEIPKGSALQHPSDYLEVMEVGIPLALKMAGIDPSQIVGLGIDFTSSTVLPVDENLHPLCLKKEYEHSYHAWVKLWKHHHTKKQTDKIFQLATQRKENWMRKLGYNISEEWMIPKIFEVFEDGTDIYNKTAYFLEASDWLVSLLTNSLTRNNCSLGFKAFWNEKQGFPTEFFNLLHPNFGETILSKLGGEIKNVGTCAGFLTQEWAEKLSLPVGLPIATGIIDAHSAVLGTGVYQAEKMLMVMGTSTCHMMLNKEEKEVSGISGVVKDAIMPGLYAYEAGQSAVGDLFGMYVKKHVPHAYYLEAEANNLSIFDFLEKKAAELFPGENGLIALDWHNGNRSVLSDADLSGLLVGLSLYTKPEEIFRAYLESTAFGAKIIAETYKEWGMNINEVVACGGLPQRNPLLMQIYADVLNMPIRISKSDYAPAIGAAILGAVAAGSQKGGYDNMELAVQAMSQPIEKTYYPVKEHVGVYDNMFQYYKQLHNYFGVRQVGMMKALKQFKEQKKLTKNLLPS
ncbi:ribulokinase [Niallia sp. NCCP-28]|uniref:ribulokinase n=1 Tax=Niallia sp. NCCP-28 TaxID=2934712 RepID=UPI002083F940|nr:ribulokinase [Niallia sp. NCCP-28]GKU83904.1 ribulokinase [Niallia sp. NCCP-28]